MEFFYNGAERMVASTDGRVTIKQVSGNRSRVYRFCLVLDSKRIGFDVRAVNESFPALKQSWIMLCIGVAFLDMPHHEFASRQELDEVLTIIKSGMAVHPMDPREILDGGPPRTFDVKLTDRLKQSLATHF